MCSNYYKNPIGFAIVGILLQIKRRMKQRNCIQCAHTQHQQPRQKKRKLNYINKNVRQLSKWTKTKQRKLCVIEKEHKLQSKAKKARAHTQNEEAFQTNGEKKV